MIRLTFSCLILISATILVGCGPTSVPSASSPGGDTKIKHTVTVPDDQLAKLAEADHADGQDDKTIHKCYVCGLGMDGSPENGVSVNGYVAHFCSAECCDHFAKDAVAVVSTTKIPQPK